MFVAYTKDGNRIYADDFDGETTCFCPICMEEVRLRKGKINKPHFAHKQNSDCKWGKDKDSKSPWHIRMQEYFSKEEREVRFTDDSTGEVHIADVFVKEANAVIEFQHSPISEEEFVGRTRFHLNNGRKIAWVFDESKVSKQETDLGRFRVDEIVLGEWPYQNLIYRWMGKPRRCLFKGPDLDKFANRYSLCIFTGQEGDLLHRVVGEKYNYEYVIFSLHEIEMNNNIDAEDLFRLEKYWASLSPLKEQLENEYILRKKAREEKKRELLRQLALGIKP